MRWKLDSLCWVWSEKGGGRTRGELMCKKSGVGKTQTEINREYSELWERVKEWKERCEKADSWKCLSFMMNKQHICSEGSHGPVLDMPNSWPPYYYYCLYDNNNIISPGLTKHNVGITRKYSAQQMSECVWMCWHYENCSLHLVSTFCPHTYTLASDSVAAGNTGTA